MRTYPKTARNQLKRIPKRGHYDQQTIFEILDAGFLCHVGFCMDNQPFVIPTAYGRLEDTIYIHGATTSRMMQLLQQKGLPVCLTVTHLDGIVVARSTFHSSMNYRSAVLFGQAQLVEGEEKEQALEIITEHILKGRWAEARQPHPNEMKATTVLKVKIEEASAKIRTGGPGDDKEDYDLPIWAGVLPIQQVIGAPIPDELLSDGIDLPESVQPYMTE